MRCAQAGQRRGDVLTLDDAARVVPLDLPHAIGNSLDKRITPALGSALLGEDAPRDSEQPGQRLVGNIFDPSPRDLERPRQRVGGTIAIGTR